MVQTHSNLGTDQTLDVIITEGKPIGDRQPWYISITAPGFPDKKILNVIQSKDQQLVDIEQLIKQYIEMEDKEYSLELAKYLEKMAKKIRDNAK
jgi:hypothetical protein